MGHGGKHTYKESIDKLFNQFDPNLFSCKILHLKSREGEESIADEIKSFCSDFCIRVIETKENIVHHSENHLSHSAGYFKDIYKAYSDVELRKQKYSLWLEDEAINYTQYGPTFTFQPNISRTNEIFIAWKEAQNYLDKLGSYHCELMSGDLLKKMTNSKTPFSFFNTHRVYAEHIG